MNTNNFAGVLFLPSVTTHGEFSTMSNVSKEEALQYALAHNALVGSKRKIGRLPQGVVPASDVLEVFSGNLIDVEELIQRDDDVLENLVNGLSVSRQPKARGLRAVYVDPTNNEISVGTTVIYNQNWAMNGVSDDTIPATIYNIVQNLADSQEDDE